MRAPCLKITMNFRMVTEESKHGSFLSVDHVTLHRSQARGAGPGPIPSRMRSEPDKGRIQCFGYLQKEMTNSSDGETREERVQGVLLGAWGGFNKARTKNWCFSYSPECCCMISVMETVLSCLLELD